MEQSQNHVNQKHPNLVCSLMEKGANTFKGVKNHVR
jgi:hypothetical protein